MSTTSIFFKHFSSDLPPITYRLLETFSALADHHQEETTEKVLRLSLELCGYRQEFSTEDLVSLLESMKNIHDKTNAEGAVVKAPSTSGKKAFGQDYLEWVNTLNIERLLLVISDYDFPTACTYYSEVPVDAISIAAELFFKSDWLTKQAALESAVVGAGGELGASKATPGYDLTNEKSSAAAEKKLKSIGF
jgi:hypothetical protein